MIKKIPKFNSSLFSLGSKIDLLNLTPRVLGIWRQMFHKTNANIIYDSINNVV